MCRQQGQKMHTLSNPRRAFNQLHAQPTTLCTCNPQPLCMRKQPTRCMRSKDTACTCPHTQRHNSQPHHTSKQDCKYPRVNYVLHHSAAATATQPPNCKQEPEDLETYCRNTTAETQSEESLRSDARLDPPVARHNTQQTHTTATTELQPRGVSWFGSCLLAKCADTLHGSTMPHWLSQPSKQRWHQQAQRVQQGRWWGMAVVGRGKDEVPIWGCICAGRWLIPTSNKHASRGESGAAADTCSKSTCVAPDRSQPRAGHPGSAFRCMRLHESSWHATQE